MYWRASDVYVNPEIEGYLMEKKLMRNAKIWCCLQGATLYLHKTQGAIQTLDMANEVHNVRKMETSTQFEINYKKGKYTFICPSATVCTDWVTALQKAMSLKSNGVGRSVFHGVIADGVDNTDEPDLSVYAMPSDDILTRQNQTVTKPDYSVYEEVRSQQPVSSDTGQTSSNVDDDSHKPPLPSMESRLAKVKQPELPGEDYVEPSPDLLKQSQEGDYSEVSPFRPCREVEYTETQPNNPQEEDEYTDGISNSNPTINVTEPNGVQFRRSKYSQAISENSMDDEEEELDKQDQANVFEELEKALTSTEAPNLDLECPLKEEDYQPAKEIHVFLANNNYLLHGVSQRFMFQKSDEDPVATLKDYLKKLEV